MKKIINMTLALAFCSICACNTQKHAAKVAAQNKTLERQQRSTNQDSIIPMNNNRSFQQMDRKLEDK